MEECIFGLENLLEELNGDILGKTNNAKYVGIATITRKDLEKLKGTNNKSKINMIGTLIFEEDITPELVRETIESVKVQGKIKASAQVKEVLDIL